jgi:hypothetical protein
MTDIAGLAVIAVLLIWAFVVARTEPECDHRLQPDMDETTGIYSHSCRCGARAEL